MCYRCSGKELPDLDFIIEKDKLVYGVDIKNWIKYEFDSITEVMEKVDLTKQLGIIPFICARCVDKDTFYKIVNMPGIVYQYETLILPPAFKSFADEAVEEEPLPEKSPFGDGHSGERIVDIVISELYS